MLRADFVKCTLLGAFSLYDVDKDGYITKTEMIEIVDAIYSMIGNVVDFSEGEETPEKRVAVIFSSMDLVSFSLENCIVWVRKPKTVEIQQVF